MSPPGLLAPVTLLAFVDTIHRSLFYVLDRYNGTARGLANCKDGGCAACNLRRIAGEEKLNECICLHAEENALLEAGRDRVFGSILYCNTCPCLRCSVKIIQTGVKEVVYNFSYKVYVPADYEAQQHRITDKLPEMPHQHSCSRMQVYCSDDMSHHHPYINKCGILAFTSWCR